MATLHSMLCMMMCCGHAATICCKLHTYVHDCGWPQPVVRLAGAGVTSMHSPGRPSGCHSHWPPTWLSVLLKTGPASIKTLDRLVTERRYLGLAWGSHCVCVAGFDHCLHPPSMSWSVNPSWATDCLSAATQSCHSMGPSRNCFTTSGGIISAGCQNLGLKPARGLANKWWHHKCRTGFPKPRFETRVWQTPTLMTSITSLGFSPQSFTHKTYRTVLQLSVDTGCRTQ